MVVAAASGPVGATVGQIAKLRAAHTVGIAKVFDAVLPLLNSFARIPVCGTIATYNARDKVLHWPDHRPGIMSQILRQSLTVRGFIQRDFIQLFSQFLDDMWQWLRDGRVQYREDIVQGLENAPDAFFGLRNGRNFGKLIIELD